LCDNLVNEVFSFHGILFLHVLAGMKINSQFSCLNKIRTNNDTCRFDCDWPILKIISILIGYGILSLGLNWPIKERKKLFEKLQ
jgi:hypothetical protein